VSGRKRYITIIMRADSPGDQAGVESGMSGRDGLEADQRQIKVLAIRDNRSVNMRYTVHNPWSGVRDMKRAWWDKFRGSEPDFGEVRIPTY
jgi:hypothetical protein